MFILRLERYSGSCDPSQLNSANLWITAGLCGVWAGVLSAWVRMLGGRAGGCVAGATHGSCAKSVCLIWCLDAMIVDIFAASGLQHAKAISSAPSISPPHSRLLSHLAEKPRTHFRLVVLPPPPPNQKPFETIKTAWEVTAGGTDASAAFEGVRAQAGLIGYLAVVTTALTNWMQAVGQRSVPAERAAVIYAMDPVYAAGFAYLLLGETLGPAGLVGAGIITGAALWSQGIQMAESDGNDDAGGDAAADGWGDEEDAKVVVGAAEERSEMLG